MPISIVLSFLVGKLLFPNISYILILMLALILAPTDAALGKAVVSDKRVPEIVRNSINVESGLNDGIVFPLFLTVLSISLGDISSGNLWGYISTQILVGALAGAGVGVVGAKLFKLSIKKGWIEHNYINLIPLALAIFAFYFAEHFSGNGYISAFFAGLISGEVSKELKDSIESFAESEGELFVMSSFLIFGFILG
jgi:NhaP-type Na+/H+ or K+/H+ antiporter